MSTPRADSVLTSLRRMTEDLHNKVGSADLLEPFRRLRLPSFSWPKLRIGDKTARTPVFQGGMGVGISLSGLATAVAESGGIGTIAANAIGMIEPDYFKDGKAANIRALRAEIRSMREKSNGLLAVNIMVAVNDFHDLLDVAIEERVDFVVMGAGLPIKGIPVERLRENSVKVVPIVSSARAAGMIFKMWQKTYHDVPDAVIVEGPLAGGHLGFSPEQIDDPDFRLEAIVPGVVEALAPYEKAFGRPIPVIAAGGVYSGEDIHRMLELGAAGVQMATRFVATVECDADDVFKQSYVDSTSEEIGLIKSPVGMPGRAIRNDFIVATEEGRRPAFRCAWKCLSSCDAESAKYCISVALNNARKGKTDKGFVFAGANAHRVSEIVPVQSLVDELSEGYRVAARSAAAKKLENLVARVQVLWSEHDGLGSRAKQLADAYEKAVAARVRDARDAGLETIRKQYTAALEKLRKLQLQITEGLAESWALLKQPIGTDPGTTGDA